MVYFKIIDHLKQVRNGVIIFLLILYSVYMAKPGDYDFYCDVALKDGADIDVVYESDNVLAFYHTKPKYDRHIVVIPKEHIHDLTYVDNGALLEEVLTVCRDIVGKWDKDYIDEVGARVLSNLGRFQDTPHLHFHVVGGDKIT